MASGALPPAFPAVRIDGELYWDGGILSNTPVEAVFDDNPRRNSLVFAVHIWNPNGPEPETHLAGAEPPEGHPVFQPRATATSCGRSRSIGCATSSRELVEQHARDERAERCRGARAGGIWLPHAHARRAPAGAGARRRGPHQGHRLQPAGIRARWEAGYADTRRVIAKAPWSGDFDPIEGFILHEARAGTEVTSG